MRTAASRSPCSRRIACSRFTLHTVAAVSLHAVLIFFAACCSDPRHADVCRGYRRIWSGCCREDARPRREPRAHHEGAQLDPARILGAVDRGSTQTRNCRTGNSGAFANLASCRRRGRHDHRDNRPNHATTSAISSCARARLPPGRRGRAGQGVMNSRYRLRASDLSAAGGIARSTIPSKRSPRRSAAFARAGARPVLKR